MNTLPYDMINLIAEQLYPRDRFALETTCKDIYFNIHTANCERRDMDVYRYKELTIRIYKAIRKLRGICDENIIDEEDHDKFVRNIDRLEDAIENYEYDIRYHMENNYGHYYTSGCRYNKDYYGYKWY